MAINVLVIPKCSASGPLTPRLACMKNSQVCSMIYPPAGFRSTETQVFVSLLPPKIFWVNQKEQIRVQG